MYLILWGNKLSNVACKNMNCDSFFSEANLTICINFQYDNMYKLSIK